VHRRRLNKSDFLGGKFSLACSVKLFWRKMWENIIFFPSVI
jgi:hypothetical protein